MKVKNRKKVIKLLCLRRLLRRRNRTLYMRSIFGNRFQRGESFLAKELRNDPYYHFRYFRMNKECYDEILKNVSPIIQRKKNHRQPITPNEKLAITIRYLATGNSQISLGLSYRISPQSVSSIVREVLTAICKCMGPKYLPKPTPDHWKKCEEGYATIWNFPNACGALDGKHVKIQCPSFSGTTYYNYKNYFSIVLLAIADPFYKFSVVDIGASGSQSDGGVYARSIIGRSLETNAIGLPEPKLVGGTNQPHVLLADDAFSLTTKMMKPYPGKFLSVENRTFNYRLSRARMSIENAFGILAARFRIFHTTIIANTELVKLIVQAAVILHNFLISKKDFNTITADSPNDGSLGNWRQDSEGSAGWEKLSMQGTNNFSGSAAQVRDKFGDYFNSDGAVQWRKYKI